MKSYWDFTQINSFAEYARYNKFMIYTLIEPEWNKYMTRKVDFPKTTFEGYLLEHLSIIFEPETIKMEIGIWFEIRNKILQ